MLDQILDLYLEINSENPDEDYEIFSRSSFIERTTVQAKREGFQLITATSGDVLAGFSFGYPMADGRWWSNCPPPPEEILLNSKFAVIELDVRKTYRGHGIGKKLLDTLLSGRPEKYATLAALPTSPAYAMYERWGWYSVGVFDDEPIMNAMVIPLKD
jgi:GNAT superfamily N-acetyltransferase